MQSSGVGITYLPVKGLIEVCKRRIEPFIVNRNFLEKCSLSIPGMSSLYEHEKGATTVCVVRFHDTFTTDQVPMQLSNKDK